LEKLVDLWIEHYDKVSEADKRFRQAKGVKSPDGSIRFVMPR
jgi:hypothetical protein